MKKLIEEKYSRKEKLSKLFCSVLIVMVVMLAMSRVVIANRLIEDSQKLKIMDKQIEEIENKNQELSERLRVPQSLSYVSVEAEKLGFTKTGKLVFLPSSSQVALKTDTTTSLR